MTPAPAETASALRIDDGRIHTLRLDGHDIARPGQNEPLWSLELFDTLDQQDRFIHARGNDRFTVRSAERDGRVTWTVCDEDGQCVAEVETWQDRQDGEIDFRLRLNRLDARYRLWRVWYPRFELAPLHEKPQQDYLITPTVYGQRIDDIHHQPSWTLGRGKAYPAVVRLRYPAKHTALQMVYYGGPAGGALMWTPDPTRRIKEFALDRNAEDRLRANWLHHPAAWVELTEPVEVSYPVRLQWVPGDWYDAAQRYRHWAMQQPWTQMGRLDQRSDVPDWLPALPSWVRVIREPTTPWEQKASIPRRWVKAIGPPMGFHWYGWDETGGPHNRDWPKHFPPRPEALELLKEYHQLGLYVMPYINARILSLEGPLWEQYKHTVVRNADGSLPGKEHWWSFGHRQLAEQARAEGKTVRQMDEVWYRIHYPFLPACLAAEKFARSVYDRTVAVAPEYDFDAVYQDQLGAWPMLCYDPAHGHAPGDPTAWADAREALYRDIHDAFDASGRKIGLISEYANESLLPYIHGSLTVAKRQLGEYPIVPLLPAVYHTHFALIGWSDDRKSDLKADPQSFLYERLMGLGLGSQMGWVGVTVPTLLDDYPQIVEAFRQGVAIRRRFGKMLGTGKMLRPPTITGIDHVQAPRPNERARVVRRPQPAVLGGMFRDETTGRRALVTLANWTDTDQAGQITLDLAELPAPVRIGWVDGESLGTFDQPTATLEFTLPARSVRALLIEAE